jgi:hypothetical protein
VTETFAGQEAMWRGTIARQARLAEDLMVLRAATPMERLLMAQNMLDPATVRATWADFAPAVPVTSAGAVATATGFVGGWAMLAALFAVVAAPFRSKREKAAVSKRRAPTVKMDPPVSRPTLVLQNDTKRPRLAGVRR